MIRGSRAAATGILLGAVFTGAASAQEPIRALEPGTVNASATASASAGLPADYVIGADDVLSVVYWREKDMSAEVVVRPDGRVALPLINELHAAGMTPEAFRDRLITAARRFVEDPNPTVMVKTINSRRVFIAGQVEKPGPYPLNNSCTVLQLIAMAGGIKEFAKGRNISIIRTEDGAQRVYEFNYQDALNRKHLEQNIALKPGDTILVP
jgi:polysaccharide biosynthesis/export protein